MPPDAPAETDRRFWAPGDDGEPDIVDALRAVKVIDGPDNGDVWWGCVHPDLTALGIDIGISFEPGYALACALSLTEVHEDDQRGVQPTVGVSLNRRELLLLLDELLRVTRRIERPAAARGEASQPRRAG